MKVLITAPYMIKEREKVEGIFNTIFDPCPEIDWVDVDERMEEPELLEIIEGYDGVICGDDRFTEKVLDRADNLKVIVKWGTGIDSINQEYAESAGIPVKNTEDAFTVPVSETTIGLCLAFARKIMASNALMKNGRWDKPQGATLSELTVGLIGVGNIGAAVARKLHCFGTNLLLNDIDDIPSDLTNLSGVREADKDEIYANCEIISLHCDLNPTSRHLLTSSSFDLMEGQPWIINTARGPLIDQGDLIEALEEELIAGAGLDVYEQEPLPSDSPLRDMDNVILSSHNSNSSQKYWEKVHRNSVGMLKEALIDE